MVEQEDYSFVERVLQTPAMLESIVGLDQLKQECEAVDMIEWEEEEEEWEAITMEIYFSFFFGLNWLVCPHFFFLQLVARGGSRA